LLVTSVLIALAVYLFRRKHVALFFGLVFFYLALVPASRLVGDPSVMPHLAERYLYFPSVGLLVALAGGLRILVQRLDSRWAISAVLVLLIVLTPLTWARNAEWSGEIRLFESDYLRGNNSESVLVGLTAAHLKAGSFRQAAEICDDHVADQERLGKLSINCAVGYSRLRRLEEAERAYLFATATKAARSKAHANLARMYLDQGRRREAKKQFELAIEAEKLPANRAWRKGHMLVRLYPRNRKKLLEARAHFEEALELQPTLAPARLWLERVDRYLGTP
jgi:tetratricopeptide (TPR) repeat protein